MTMTITTTMSMITAMTTTTTTITSMTTVTTTNMSTATTIIMPHPAISGRSSADWNFPPR